MRQLVSFESARQPSTACLSTDNKKLLYIAGHQLSAVDLELSSSATRALSTIPLPKPLEEKSHELMMITLSDNRRVCIWNSGWCVVKTLPKPGFPCPVEVMLDVELPLGSVEQLTESTLLCVGKCDQETTVHAFDAVNGQLLSSNPFPGLHSISSVTTQCISSTSAPSTVAPVKSSDSPLKGASLTEEGLVALSGSRSGDGQPTLFLYWISVGRSSNGGVEFKSNRVGSLTISALPSALIFEKCCSVSEQSHDEQRYRVAALSEDGKIIIFQWLLETTTDEVATRSSPAADSPTVKQSARCEQLAAIDNTLTGVKFHVWEGEKLFLSSSEGIFYISTNTSPEDFHLVKLSGSSVLCGPIDGAQLGAPLWTVVPPKVSVCIFDDGDEEVRKPGSRKSKTGSRKKRGSKKRASSPKKRVSDASTAVNAGETENPVSDDAPDNEIDITNEKRIGLLKQWEALELTAMPVDDYNAWKRHPRNIRGLQALQDFSEIAGEEASTIEVRRMARRILRMIKRQVAKRKEAAEEASRPKRCALNLGSLLASQEQGDLREVPTGPVNLGTKPEDDLVVGTVKCGDECDVPQAGEDLADEQPDYTQQYDDNDEGAVTDDALTSTWKKVDDEIIWRRKPDQKQEEDDWKSNDKDWWKKTGNWRGDDTDSWKDEEEKWWRKDGGSSYGGRNRWRRGDEGYGWWTDRKPSYSPRGKWDDGGGQSTGWGRGSKRPSDAAEEDKWGKQDECSAADGEQAAVFVAEEMWEGPDGDWWFKCPSTGVWKRQSGKGNHPPQKKFRRRREVETDIINEDRVERGSSVRDKTASQLAESTPPSGPSKTSEGRRSKSPIPTPPSPKKIRPPSAESNLTGNVIDLDDDTLDVQPYIFPEEEILPDSSDPAETSGEQLASRVIAGDRFD
ncbi:hypothetical protein Pmar_PMAR002950 [Perkinsus marinus ATCC 50983]|uniref:Uncharacterized protein n=1 Tax=Perkinsus marinus (strain ATCC 50983 / TXsc) TaxID=423536 RepID=C5LQZ5_PERM5|nr:hypothetical protein Pmar_PMAR002950 [Perkinsus marinus ATCC 50983]EER00880.1 hypothetical protein Pmar_PMAR002950 [Perkinsus marinus ATCC 50983]|eukprot:XP_002768162.1 hypothetical protein Pmar_PMAR002950 [Perkinsus marinus ATCC 50983]